MAERRKTHHSWKTRRDMVIRGMTISLPWFAFINEMCIRDRCWSIRINAVAGVCALAVVRTKKSTSTGKAASQKNVSAEMCIRDSCNPDYSLRLARNCRAESEYSFWDIYRYRFAMRFCRWDVYKRQVKFWIFLREIKKNTCLPQNNPPAQIDLPQ